MNLLGLVRESFETVIHEMEAACAEDAANENRNQEPVPEPDAISDDSSESVSAPAIDPAMSMQIDLLAEVMRRIAANPGATDAGASRDTEAEQEDESEPNTVTEQLLEIAEAQSELSRMFEARLRSDDVQSRAVDRLHDELQDSRKRLQRSEMTPLLKDIIFCHDFVERQLSEDCDGPVESLKLVGQMLLDVLFKYDVEPFRGEGDDFDRKLQQCVETVPADSPEHDRKIADHGLSGFRLDETIVRREQVSVYRYSEECSPVSTS